MKDWNELPANAQTIRTIEACLDRLIKSNPYPPNMKPDRLAFAACREGYAAAVFELEKFICEQTEDIKLVELAAMDEMEKIVNRTDDIISQINECNTRKQAARVYTQLLIDRQGVSFNAINEAIETKWSLAGLKYIKQKAWEMIE